MENSSFQSEGPGKMVQMNVKMVLPLGTITEEHRRNKKYVDLMLCTCNNGNHSAEGGDGHIFGHRIILEQIPFIKNQCMMQTPQQIIYLPELNPAAVEAIVRMYYTRKLYLTDEFPLECTLLVAEKFGIEGMLNCWTLREVAQEQNNFNFLAIIDEYIVQNFSKSMESQLSLLIPYGQMAYYVTRWVKRQIEHSQLLTSIINWGNHDSENRRRFLYSLVIQLDFVTIFDTSPSLLRNAFAPDSLLARVPSCVQHHNKILTKIAYRLKETRKRKQLSPEPRLDQNTNPEVLSLRLPEPINAAAKMNNPDTQNPVTMINNDSVVYPYAESDRKDSEKLENSAFSDDVVLGLSSPHYSPHESMDFLESEDATPSSRNSTKGPLAPESDCAVAVVGPSSSSSITESSMDTSPTSRETSTDSPPPLLEVSTSLSITCIATNQSPPTLRKAVPDPANEVLLYQVEDSNTRYLEAFDFEDNTVHRLHIVRRPREFSSLVQAGNVIYDIGGSNRGCHNSVWDEMNSVDWVDTFVRGLLEPKKEISLTNGRRNFSSIYLPDRSIYIIGGDVNETKTKVLVSNSVEIVDTSKKSKKWNVAWKSLLNTPRSCHASAVLDNHIYTAGGIGEWRIGDPNSTAMKRVEVFHPENGCWRRVAQMKVGRRCFRLCVMDKKLYAIGGEDSSSRFLRSAEVYDPDENEWQYIEDMNHARANFGIFKMDGVIYVVGGNTGEELTIEAYNPVRNLWNIIPWPKQLNRQAIFRSSIPITRNYVYNKGECDIII